MKWNRDCITYPHEVLWRAALTSLRTAKSAQATVRPDHLSLLALLSGFMAFEVFVNRIGDEVAPEAWKDERTHFSQGQYRGLAGKVQYLSSKFPGLSLKKGEEPYQTFVKVKRFRDGVAHVRAHAYSEESESEIVEVKVPWDDYELPTNVERALEQLRTLAETLRQGALSVLEGQHKLSHLRYPAFAGPIGTAFGEEVDG